MSNLGNIIVGMFRRVGTILSFSIRKRPYRLPHKHLYDNIDGYYVPKKRTEPILEPDDIPLPKSSAKPPKLSVIQGGKDSKSN